MIPIPVIQPYPRLTLDVGREGAHGSIVVYSTNTGDASFEVKLFWTCLFHGGAVATDVQSQGGRRVAALFNNLALAAHTTKVDRVAHQPEDFHPQPCEHPTTEDGSD